MKLKKLLFKLKMLFFVGDPNRFFKRQTYSLILKEKLI